MGWVCGLLSMLVSYVRGTVLSTSAVHLSPYWLLVDIVSHLKLIC